MWLNILGIALRAGKIKTGEGVIASIRSGEAKLIIIAEDASDRTKKTITNKSKFYEVEYIIISTAWDISKALGKENRVALAVNDAGFAASIKAKMGEEK